MCAVSSALWTQVNEGPALPWAVEKRSVHPELDIVFVENRHLLYLGFFFPNRIKALYIETEWNLSYKSFSLKAVWFVSWMPVMRQDSGTHLYFGPRVCSPQIPWVNLSGPLLRQLHQVEVPPRLWAPAWGGRCHPPLFMQEETQNSDGHMVRGTRSEWNQNCPTESSKSHIIFFSVTCLWWQGQRHRLKRRSWLGRSIYIQMPTLTLPSLLST